ncbi:MAG: hypothetical protein IPH52_16940 [Leptospiraceae bacterium]|nr:hypothetical protein [Leptospiraceae bacterium]
MSTPEDVIRDLINGIKKDELHVIPGMFAKTTEFLSRMVPQGMSFFFEFLK